MCHPFNWNSQDVRSWLMWQICRHSLPMIALEYFQMDGMTLCTLKEHDFQQRAPECGETLYVLLEIWKTDKSKLNTDSGVITSDYGSEGTQSDDEISEDGCEVSSPSSGQQANVTSTGGRASGSHIHLWQFLKELLSQPQEYGSCIRWTDRQKGIFKIEDSVRVARLWGKRKNRPAMNYDKLSRSIRQYYKKGIMKKTERSQRLVYQFCHPYSQQKRTVTVYKETIGRPRIGLRIWIDDAAGSVRVTFKFVGETRRPQFCDR
ncbi:DNA-binding protein D-ETS-4-like isoform X2 [Leptotrombidium deliense]|uniref:DNA-binding protein D-ETS-4-like isoform X2 n=1 Tax=Leptotrombidium deliense TaxID=299467 RepID=A0A443SII4_9ACAR|nr:DNA-binding protein D-ETS-4-like isoform X2 [Leptotrombidium deliense]